MADMSNEQIIEEFGQLFGTNETEDEPEVEETQGEEPTEETEETEGTEEESTEESNEEENTEESERKSTSNKQSKQNYAFAQQRQQIKEHRMFLENLGKLIGMEGAKPEDIQTKVQEVLLAKQSQEQNIPIDILRRLDNAERIIQENNQIKHEAKVQNAFMELIEKHHLDKDAVDSFTQHLIESGKNPAINQDVDIEAEYLKLHFQDMIDSAVEEAVKKEQERQAKVKEKSVSSTDKGAGGAEPGKINSVKDLDSLFNSMDL